MTLEVHSVEIKVKDSATGEIRKIGASAKQLGQDMSRSMDQAEQSTRRFNVTHAAMGAALTTVTGLMSDWARAAAEDEASTARLAQAIDNTGKSYDDFSQSVDKAIASGQKKAFSDDQVREALTRLTTTTGDATVALQELGLVEDFARARGIDLGTSADIIGKAYEGNTAILARYGIQLDKNATGEEALAAIQQKVHGQADAFASTRLGWIEQEKIKIDELTESWGYQLGKMQGVIALLPGLNAGYSALSGVLSGFAGGGSGLAGITNMLALGTQIAGIGALGTIAYGYSQNDVGTTFANDLANKIFLVMASLLNATVPGQPFDTQKYIDQQAKNSTWDQILGSFGSPEAAGKALGIQGNPIYGGTTFGTGGGSGENAGNIGYDVPNGPGTTQGTEITGYAQPTADQVYAAIVAAAASGNMTVAQYLATPAVKKQALIANAIPGTGYGGVYSSGYGSLAGSPPPSSGPGSGFPAWVGLRPGMSRSAMYGEGTNAAVSSMGGSGAVANDISGRVATGHGGGISNYTGQEIANQSLSATKDLNTELEKRVGIFANLVNGQETWNDAQAQFKSVQDGLLGQETVYTQQLSEYNGQVNAITAAHELLNKRVEEGIPLTAEQQKFQDSYTEALERGNGAIDDATISQGMLAEQYLLNMEKGDQLNQTMGEQTGAVGDLVDVVGQLILALEGVPPDVQTTIDLLGADEVIAEARLIQYALEAASGTYHASFIIDTVSGNAPQGPQLPQRQHGGIMAARHGRVMGDYTLVGEDGPELIAGGQGGMVIPASATRAMRKGGSGGITIQGNVVVYANDPRQFSQQMSEYALGSAR